MSDVSSLSRGRDHSSVREWLAIAVVILSLLPRGLAGQSSGIPAGFTPIFNGRDLNGWHVSRTFHHGTVPSFTVEDGNLVLRQNPIGQGGVLLTDRKYKNFELYLEANPEWGTNSGIFFRMSESGSGYQVEVVPGRGTRNGDLMGEELRISAQGSAAALIDSVWKADDWNSYRIRVEGDTAHITLWMNGTQMWDARATRNDQIADLTDGMIGFELHWSLTNVPIPDGTCCTNSWRPGGAIRYRNIAIRELP